MTSLYTCANTLAQTFIQKILSDTIWCRQSFFMLCGTANEGKTFSWASFRVFFCVHFTSLDFDSAAGEKKLFRDPQSSVSPRTAHSSYLIIIYLATKQQRNYIPTEHRNFYSTKLYMTKQRRAGEDKAELYFFFGWPSAPRKKMNDERKGEREKYRKGHANMSD